MQETGSDDPGGDFWISAGEPQSPRSHIAFRAADEEHVNMFHRAAIEAGGTDNGPPDLRPTSSGEPWVTTFTTT